MKTVFSSSVWRIPFLSRGTALFVTTVLAGLLWEPQGAQAAMTLGFMLCNVAITVASLPPLYSGIAYIGGGMILASGLHLLVKNQDSPGNMPLHQPLARMAGGSALMALPAFVSMLVKTFYTTAQGGGLSVTSCTPGGHAVSTSTISPDNMIAVLVNNIKEPFILILSATAIVMGIFLVMRGLLKASKYGTDPRACSIPNILVNLTIGSLLIIVGQSVSMIMGTVFGGSGVNPSSDVLNWAAITNLNASPQFILAIQSALTFFQLMGMLAFVRGLYIVKNAVEGGGQATMAQGFTHMIGGVLAINIFYFLEILDSTMGTQLL